MTRRPPGVDRAVWWSLPRARRNERGPWLSRMVQRGIVQLHLQRNRDAARIYLTETYETR